ncbi:MAG: terpene cyclase/mutase family protein, partial [Planctomycetales bacterium]|nr:terpene cyclase/mutase family protein [Planctomycetales bacterium]
DGNGEPIAANDTLAARPPSNAPPVRNLPPVRVPPPVDARPHNGNGPNGNAPSGDNRPTKPAGADDETDEDELIESALSHNFLVFTAAPSWLTSIVVHAIALLILALVTYKINLPNAANMLTVMKSGNEKEVESFIEDQLETLQFEDIPPTDVLPEINADTIADIPMISSADDLTAPPLSVQLSEIGLNSAPMNDLLSDSGVIGGKGLEGRGAAARARLVRTGGGTPESEAAVTDALKWFVKHQNGDGSWSLDHRTGPCQGRCGDPGSKAPSLNGATALSLLPFLGSGHTHMDGEYSKTVEYGLAFLIRNMEVHGDRGSLVDEGNYYSHGLATIVLCEAYAMTHDQKLARPAQMAINEIVWAQDPVGGGWRYRARQPGDTSVVGWQLMALKSGHMAYLNVPPSTVKMASRFLDSVQEDYGARYGYTSPARNRPSTTSVGLLCRMYLGWKQDHPGLQNGIEYLAKSGPSENDMYYNYYATQVLRHNGGPVWDEWNQKMREFLVKTQEKDSHRKGSWVFVGGSGAHANGAGGRLYCTALSAMILEVYYRYMPIYQQQAAEEEFPLD